MKIMDALGLGSGTDRVPVPLRTWVPTAVLLAALAMALLLLSGVGAGWAVPVGLAVGLVLAIPVGTAVTLRRR
jgi:predicted transporter